MEIAPLRKEYLSEAAALFVQNFQQQRQDIPDLPDTLADIDRIVDRLDRRTTACPGAAALIDGRLAGYMSWFLVDHFRGTDRKGAYCPEWGHAAVAGSKAEIYRALYRAAAAQWAAEGSKVHAITLLAGDLEAEKVWFWNGFGLTVVDAVRPIQPLNLPVPQGCTIRKADVSDAGVLSVLEAEHWKHYQEPPVLMQVGAPCSAPEFTEFLSSPQNGAWLAYSGNVPAGYIRLQSSSDGACAVVSAGTTIAITGAYTRPLYRGKGLAPAVLDAALKDYAARGFERCSVDFESFNPEAVSFWMKYFRPVCFSLLRVPEK
jgi:GNAT superfamily N-acetyltransferase